MIWRAVAIMLCLFVLQPTAAHAVEPDEILKDPLLEERARGISKELRCLVCRNESIDDSSADLARDLRLLVRERLLAGDTDQQVIDFVVARYGEFVLLRPVFSWKNAVLWAAGPLIFLLGLFAAIAFIRKRPATGPQPLSKEEQQRLRALLED